MPKKLHQSPGTVSKNTAILILDLVVQPVIFNDHTTKKRNQDITVDEQNKLDFACAEFLLSSLLLGIAQKCARGVVSTNCCQSDDKDKGKELEAPSLDNMLFQDIFQK